MNVFLKNRGPSCRNAAQGMNRAALADALKSSTLFQISAEVRESAGIKREKKPEKYGHENWVYFLSAMNDALVAEGFSESFLLLSPQKEKKMRPCYILWW